MKKRNLLKFLLKYKKNIRGVYLLGALGGLYSCGGGGGGGSGGGGSAEDEGLDLRLTSGNDVRDYGDAKESFILDGMEGKDDIRTGGESDVLRGGLDEDVIKTGAGDDVILLVGVTEVGEYAQEDVEEMLKLVLNADSGGRGDNAVDELNDRKQTEAVKGEVIDGEEGTDTLVIYGKVDLREVEVKNVERMRLHSELILTEKQLLEFKSVKGDGESVLILEASSREVLNGEIVVEFDVEELEELSGIERLEIGVGVKLVVSSELGLKILSNIGEVGGDGQVEYRNVLGSGGGDGGGSEVEVDGDGGLSALDLLRLGREIFTEEFIDNEQILVEGDKEAVDEVLGEKTALYVFVLKENETVVDVKDFVLTASMNVLASESDGDFTIENGELRSVAIDYEMEDYKGFVVHITDGMDIFRVKVLLVDVNEASEFSGDIGGSIRESEDESIVGTIIVEDEDGESDEYLFSGDIEGEYGVLNVKKDGVWEYKLNEDDFRVSNLLEGESLTDSIEVMSVGGTREDVIITINGYGAAEEDVLPEISIELKGEGFVGEELRMEIVGEDEGLFETGSYSFVWYRGDVEIDGEVGEMYVLKAEDVGETIKGKLILGRFERETEEGIEVFEKKFSYVLTIEGDEREGEMLSVTIGDIVLVGGDGSILDGEDFDYEYYWFVDGEKLSGEKGESYELKKEDGGKVVKVGVLLSYKGGDGGLRGAKGYVEEESGVIGYVDSLLEGELSLRGDGVEGELLFVNIEGLTDEDGLEDAMYSYQWYRGDVGIEGAVYRSYLLGQEDVGGSISVRVTVVDDEGNVGSVSVSVEQLIEDVENAVVGRVKILGKVYEFETITANVEGLSDLDGLNVGSYEYKWYRDGEELLGESGQELLIEDGWLGSKVMVELSFMDELGNEYVSRSFEREVYNERSPEIVDVDLEVNEGTVGVIGTLEAEFLGVGDLSYSVGSPYDEVFRVNAGGVVEILVRQDYEVVDRLDVLITVSSEAGVSSSEEISIYVRDVDDESPTAIGLLDDVGNVLLNYEVREGSTDVIGTLVGTDVDTDVRSLFFTEADARFRVGVEIVSGVVYYELKGEDVLDYEGADVVAGTAVVLVTVSDGENAVFSENLTITVIDVDDESPSGIGLLDEFGVDLLSYEVREGSTDVIGTLVGTDVDTAVEDLIFTEADVRFVIERVVGSAYYVLKGEDVLDYEGADVVAGTAVVLVTVSDGENAVFSENLMITVEDVDDEYPSMIRLEVGGIEVGDIVAIEGSVVELGTLVATDVDTADADLEYEISDDRFEVEMMGSGTGVYYVLRAIGVLDYEGAGVVSGVTMVEITVTDGGNNTAVESLEVTVGDVDDESPDDLRILNKENVREGEVGVVGTLVGTDVDTAAGDLLYSTDEVDGLFTVERVDDGRGGSYYLLKTKASLDYEDVDVVSVDGTAVVLVTVSDGVNAVFSKSFDVVVVDVNDHAPVISDSGFVSAAIDEKLVGAIVIGTITVVDDDRTEENRMISYTVSNDRFSLDEVTGRVFFEPFEISGAHLEVETLLTADDGGGNPASVGISVTVDNTDGSQDVQIFDQSFRINEGLTEFSDAVTATGEPRTFSVAEDSNFIINAESGLLSFKVAADYEDASQRAYSVLVTVRGGTNNSVGSAVIRVLVEDVDDTSPSGLGIFNGGLLLADIIVAEGDVGVLGTLSGTDVDTMEGGLSYSVDDSRFAIEERIVMSEVYNVFRATVELDYEGDDVSADGTAVVLVTVSDGLNAAVSFSLVVTVRESDDELPENLRLLSSSGDVISGHAVDEGSVSVVGTLTADDLDTASADLVYSTDDVRFRVVKFGVMGSHRLESNRLLDYDDNDKVVGGTTNIEVTVMDSGRNSDVLSLDISVRDVDDESPENLRLLDINDGSELLDIGVIEGSTKILGELVADDVDTARSGLVFHSLDDRFTVSRTTILRTGERGYLLSSESELDYDADIVVNGTTLVTIRVTDGGNNVYDGRLLVSVGDVDDESPSMIGLLDVAGDVIGTIEAEEESEMILGTLTAVDLDTVGSRLSFSFGFGG